MFLHDSCLRKTFYLKHKISENSLVKDQVEIEVKMLRQTQKTVFIETNIIFKKIWTNLEVDTCDETKEQHKSWNNEVYYPEIPFAFSL